MRPTTTATAASCSSYCARSSDTDSSDPAVAAGPLGRSAWTDHADGDPDAFAASPVLLTMIDGDAVVDVTEFPRRLPRHPSRSDRGARHRRCAPSRVDSNTWNEAQKEGRMPLLPSIAGPRDLDTLSMDQLRDLAGEIRAFLVETSRAPVVTSVPTSAWSS